MYGTLERSKKLQQFKKKPTTFIKKTKFFSYMKDITFLDSQGNSLLGTISIPPQADSVIIISHGFTSNKDSKLYLELQDEFNKLGIGTFRYDYYGHGKLYCEGEGYGICKDVTVSKTVESLKAAIKTVKNMGNYNIGLFGSSFGGLLSIIAASQDSDIKLLALKSPVTEPIKFWNSRLSEEEIKKWKTDGIMHYHFGLEDYDLEYPFFEDLYNFNTLESAKQIKCPVLIVHGSKDTYVPIKQSRDLAKILNTEVNIVSGADHGYETPKQYLEMKQLIIEFVNKTTKKI